MPYFDHNMATNISDDLANAITAGKVIRRVPPNSRSASNKEADEKPNEAISSKYRINLDMRKLMFMRNLLKAEIENLKRQRAALKIKDHQKLYDAFTVERGNVLVSGKDSKLFEASNKNYSNHPVACRIYESKVGINPKTSLYLKCLRHLGKKHVSIVHTWDLFVDSDKNIQIFQEYCSKGTLEKYVNEKKLTETEISLYAWQLLRGMDFLGDIGIVHREIHPKNLVLRPATSSELCILKITNFRQATVYWSIEENDIIFLTCRDVNQQAADGANYQAPEVYGDPAKEQFDPVIADTWSYGAVIFHMATRKYPYDPTKTYKSLEEEIQGAVNEISTLTDLGKELVGNILCTNAGERMPIGFVDKNAWFNEAKKIRVSAAVKNVGSASKVPRSELDGGKLFEDNPFMSKFFVNPEEDEDDGDEDDDDDRGTAKTEQPTAGKDAHGSSSSETPKELSKDNTSHLSKSSEAKVASVSGISSKVGSSVSKKSQFASGVKSAKRSTLQRTSKSKSVLKCKVSLKNAPSQKSALFSNSAQFVTCKDGSQVKSSSMTRVGSKSNVISKTTSFNKVGSMSGSKSTMAKKAARSVSGFSKDAPIKPKSAFGDKENAGKAGDSIANAASKPKSVASTRSTASKRSSRKA